MKLLRLKQWLTLEEAARHLSHVFEEDVSEADILRLALDGHLTLSIDFVNYALARLGQIVPIEQAAVTDRRSIDGAILRMYEGERIDDKRVLECERKITRISGVWDLWLIGDAKNEIEHRYQQITGGPTVELMTVGGFVSVHDEEKKQYAWLQESFDDNPYQPGSSAHGENIEAYIEKATRANEIGADEVQALRDQYKKHRKKYLMERERRSPEQNCYPKGDLPENARLVVRTAALRDFEAQTARAASGMKNIADEEHMSGWLMLLNQAAKQWWSTADHDDSRTHPTNANVSAWLQERGMSQTMADAAARIIRPSWATNGRRPE